MVEQNPDLSISADTFLPPQTPTGATSLYGFTITNTGPGLAENIQANITIPSGLLPLSTATTFGAIQLNNNNFRLSINQLATEESVTFSLTTTNLNAQGTITTTAVVTSTTTDPLQSNNTASITGTFVGSQPQLQLPHPRQRPHLIQRRAQALISKACHQNSLPPAHGAFSPKVLSLEQL